MAGAQCEHGGCGVCMCAQRARSARAMRDTPESDTGVIHLTGSPCYVGASPGYCQPRRPPISIVQTSLLNGTAGQHAAKLWHTLFTLYLAAAFGPTFGHRTTMVVTLQNHSGNSLRALLQMIRRRRRRHKLSTDTALEAPSQIVPHNGQYRPLSAVT